MADNPAASTIGLDNVDDQQELDTPAGLVASHEQPVAPVASHSHVDIPGAGTVSLPNSLGDKLHHVAKAIHSHFNPPAPTNPEGLEQEDTGNNIGAAVKNALSVLPSDAYLGKGIGLLGPVQKYVNEPLDKMTEAGSSFMGKAALESTLNPIQEPGVGEQIHIDPEEFKKTNPTAAGIIEGVGESVGGFAADPRNWPFMASGAARPILKAAMTYGFAGLQAHGLVEEANGLAENWDNLTPEERAKGVTKLGLSTAMTEEATRHATKSAAKIVSVSIPGIPEAIHVAADKAEAVAKLVYDAVHSPEGESGRIGPLDPKGRALNKKRLNSPISDEAIQTILASHKEKGGSTTNIKTGESTTNNGKFAVGAYPDRTVTLDHDPTEQEIRDYATNNSDLLIGKSDEHSLGTWDRKDAEGNRDLDVVRQTSEKQAQDLGRENRQLTIQHLQEGSKLGDGTGTIPVQYQISDALRAEYGTSKQPTGAGFIDIHGNFISIPDTVHDAAIMTALEKAGIKLPKGVSFRGTGISPLTWAMEREGLIRVRVNRSPLGWELSATAPGKLRPEQLAPLQQAITMIGPRPRLYIDRASALPGEEKKVNVYRSVSDAKPEDVEKTLRDIKAYNTPARVVTPKTPVQTELPILGQGKTAPVKATQQPLAKPETFAGADISKPALTYPEAASTEGANPYIRSSADGVSHNNPSNEKRQLLVQFASDLLMADSGTKDEASAYYDKLYSGQREGFSRLSDFWEIPQWMGYAAHIFPDADVYVVRDIKQAVDFLNKAGYGRIGFSALDVNKGAIRKIAEGYKGHVDVGGYVDPKTFDDLPHVKWHDSLKSMAQDAGVPYRDGVDYRHFQGSKVIPRLTLSTGCLHKCAFCTIEKQLKMPENATIEQATDAIAGLGSKLIYINDKTFGQATNYKMLADLNTRVKAKNPDFKGFIVQTTAAQMGKFTDEYLQKSGIKFVELGIETYNDPILKEMHKPATERLIDKSVDRLRKNKIALIPNIIIGLPGETAESYAHTYKWMKDNADIISHANIYNLALYENTELAKQITTASAADYNENVTEKSFHANPQIVRQYAGDMYGLAGKMLDQPESELGKARPISEAPEFIGSAQKQSPANSAAQELGGTKPLTPGEQIEADIKRMEEGFAGERAKGKVEFDKAIAEMRKHEKNLRDLSAIPDAPIKEKNESAESTAKNNKEGSSGVHTPAPLAEPLPEVPYNHDGGRNDAYSDFDENNEYHLYYPLAMNEYKMVPDKTNKSVRSTETVENPQRRIETAAAAKVRSMFGLATLARLRDSVIDRTSGPHTAPADVGQAKMDEHSKQFVKEANELVRTKGKSGIPDPKNETYFHGTDPDSTEAILREGISAKHTGESQGDVSSRELDWQRSNEDKPYPGTVFLTDDFDEAARYSHKGNVIEVSTPYDLHKRFEGDPVGSQMHHGDIPAEHIVAVHSFEDGKWVRKPVEKTAGTAEGAKKDTDLFQAAKTELGPDATVSEVARRAQELKDGAPKYGENNKLITTDKYEKAKATLSKKITDASTKLNSAIPGAVLFDTEMMGAAFEVALYHIEAGARTIGALGDRLLSEYGPSIQPYISKLWETANQAGAKEATPERIAEAKDAASHWASTRRPFGEKAEKIGAENPLADNLVIGYDSINPDKVTNPALKKVTAELQTKLADTVSDYDIFPEEDKKLPPSARLEKFVNLAKNNLLFLYDKIPAAKRALSKQWYNTARAFATDRAAKHGYTTPQVAGVIAALSPQTPWEANLALAERIMDIVQNKQDFRATPEMMRKGNELSREIDENGVKTGSAEISAVLRKLKGKTLGELTDPNQKAGWIRLYDETYNPQEYRAYGPDGKDKGVVKNLTGHPTKLAWQGHDAIRKALSIMEDGSKDNISNNLGYAHKVRNFYNNILAPNHPAERLTIDTHAVGAALLKMVSGKTQEVKDNFGSPGSKVTGVHGTYPLYMEAYTRAAHELGIRPSELQSIVWEEIRNLFDPELKTPENIQAIDDMWKAYRRGEMTESELRNQIYKAPEMMRRQMGFFPRDEAEDTVGGFDVGNPKAKPGIVLPKQDKQAKARVKAKSKPQPEPEEEPSFDFGYNAAAESLGGKAK